MGPKSRRYGEQLCEFALGNVRMGTLWRDRGRRIIPVRGQPEQGRQSWAEACIVLSC